MSGSNSKAAALGSAVGPAGLVTGKEEKKKAGGGVLNRLKGRRQAPHHAADDGIGAAVTEQELLALDTIRPEHVLRLSQVTESEYGAGRVLPSASGRRYPLSSPLLPPSIFPSIRVFSSESALCIRWPKYWSFSFNISPSNYSAIKE